MLDHRSLALDVKARIARVQSMMNENGVAVLVVVGAGAADAMGSIRYLSNARLWGGAGYVILGAQDPYPWLLSHSSYQALWSREGTTTLQHRVESPSDVLTRVAELTMNYVEGDARIGVVNATTLMPVRDSERMLDLLKGRELVDLTLPFDAIRQIKTPFEIEAMIQNGAILDASFDVFREHAKVGARYWDACAAVESYVNSRGAFWGRTKVSLDRTPYTIPTQTDRRIQRDDIINFEIVYESELGYWAEMTSVFSFAPLPEYERRLLDAYMAAAVESSVVARSGATFRQVADTNDRVIAEHGFAIGGKHTPDCHSIGLDGSDGPSTFSDPDFVLKSNMVLSFHPGTILESGHGFLLSDNFLVTPLGATRLSPHGARRYHILLDG